jgi:micrococcal nuclease
MKYPATFIENYDGDTIDIIVEVWPDIKLHLDNARLYGIDTPELKTVMSLEKAKAIAAKDYLKKRLKDKKFYIEPIDKGKYGRWLINVYVGGVNINEELIDKGLARPYHGGKKEEWNF